MASFDLQEDVASTTRKPPKKNRAMPNKVHLGKGASFADQASPGAHLAMLTGLMLTMMQHQRLPPHDPYRLLTLGGLAPSPPPSSSKDSSHPDSLEWSPIRDSAAPPLTQRELLHRHHPMSKRKL